LGTNGPILIPVPAPETIQEFKVQTSLYAANEDLRNAALNANDMFLKAARVKRPVLRRNVFAATLGGAVRHNRAFFFVPTRGRGKPMPHR